MSNDTCVIAIDAGTTGVRSRAVFVDGRDAVASYREFTQHYPQAGVGRARRGRDLGGGQGHPRRRDRARRARPGRRDRHHQPARDGASRGTAPPAEPHGTAIVWQDRRTAARCDELAAAGHLPLVRARTGLVLDPYFSGTKFEWLLRERGVPTGPDLALGTIDSWLIWNLTGGEVHATDVTNASRTMLYDIVDRRWSDELCDILHVPIDALPEVRPSSGRFGVTSERCGVPAGIPVSGVAGDQQAALFGQACFTAGHGQEHLRHRQLRAAQRRPRLPRTDRGHAHHHRVGAGRRHGRLRARGRDLRHRRRHAVAARRHRHHRPVRRGRPARGERSRHRRGVRRARRSRAWAHRGGTRTPAARSWASPAAPRGPTSPGRSSSRSRSRSATPSTR